MLEIIPFHVQHPLKHFSKLHLKVNGMSFIFECFLWEWFWFHLPCQNSFQNFCICFGILVLLSLRGHKFQHWTKCISKINKKLGKGPILGRKIDTSKRTGWTIWVVYLLFMRTIWQFAIHVILRHMYLDTYITSIKNKPKQRLELLI